MPAPWSTPGPFTALATLVAGLIGVQWSQVGVPESVPAQVGAYLTLGGQQVDNKATGGLMQRRLSYRVVFCYALDGAETTAETTIAALIDAFIAAIFADRTLGGTLESLDVDASEADQPRYVGVAGAEFREYPLRITGVQRSTFPVQ
jgi:hypothetical protein